MFNFFKNIKANKSNQPQKKPTYDEYPQEFLVCKEYVDNLEIFFEIDCLINDHYHYIGLNRTDCKLIDVHTKVLGFVGHSRPAQQVLCFVKPPREVTIEEFLKLAENKYKGIQVLYNGINKDNLPLYKDMTNWYWLQSPYCKQQAKPREDIVLYFFNQPYDERCIWKKKSEIYPLVHISEFLIEKGFVFEKAVVGGGTDEISHSGTAAYDASYLQLEEFKENFEKDKDLSKTEIKKKYCGWASLDYRYISVHLRCGSIKLHIEISEKISMKWNHIDSSNQQIIEETIQKMVSILGSNVDVLKRLYVQSSPD